MKIICALDPTKACGPDLITGKMLKMTADAVSLPLFKLFNMLFENGIFPEIWKSGNICPIFKKDNMTDLIKYRPITLLSIISKIFEKHNCQ